MPTRSVKIVKTLEPTRPEIDPGGKMAKLASAL